MPLPISLDPARRTTWEAELGKQSAQRSADKPAGTASSKREPSPPPVIQEAVKAEIPPVPVASSSAPPKTAESAPEQPSLDVPALQGDETYSSTAYKARLIAQHIKGDLERHRKSGAKEPMYVGLQGPQGCGKSDLLYIYGECCCAARPKVVGEGD